MLVKFTYNPSERQKSTIDILRGLLGIELMTLLGVLYI